MAISPTPHPPLPAPPRPRPLHPPPASICSTPSSSPAPAASTTCPSSSRPSAPRRPLVRRSRSLPEAAPPPHHRAPGRRATPRGPHIPCLRACMHAPAPAQPLPLHWPPPSHARTHAAPTPNIQCTYTSACTHACTCTHMRACAHMHAHARIHSLSLPSAQTDAQGLSDRRHFAAALAPCMGIPPMDASPHRSPLHTRRSPRPQRRCRRFVRSAPVPQVTPPASARAPSSSLTTTTRWVYGGFRV